MHQKTIMLVEDNPDDELLTLRALKKNNIVNEVVVAHDGEEALEFLLGSDTRKHPEKLPVLILLDLKLPKIDGLEVLKALRNDDLTRTIPVVILSTSVEETDIIKGYHHGANSYIQKPVNFSEFTEAVRQIGGYWLLLNKSI